ncbi:MAG TPA: YidB family protein [Devosia sp.]|jgi:uncharacterized protein YidB (DUF937 family)|nr:YidB family protein [Devosia sp.]
MARGLNMGSAGMALLGLLAVKGFQHRDDIGRMLGGMSGSGQAGQGGSNGLGGMLGGLGDMLGGGASSGQGKALNEGLGSLLDRFRQTGHGEEAESWVSKGPNRSVDPQHLEAALGDDVLEQLQAQTGLSRSDLLQRLSSNLPDTVDRLTPEGRVPSEQEADRYSPSGQA